MKRIIFSLIAIALVFRFWPGHEEEPVQAEPVQAEVVEEVEEETIVPAQPKQTDVALKPTPKVVKMPKSMRRKLPPDMVEFELLKDNWAVSHGDILLGKLQSKIKGNRGQFKPKKSILWESGTIAYAMSSKLPKDQVLSIVETLEQISVSTNVEFQQVSGDFPQDYLIFMPSDEICASYLGKIGGQQPIFLKPDCGSKEIRHEAMHALGFVHEQSRKDRDQYVKINWDNIEPGFENQFDIAPDAYLENYRGFVFAFDYNSVMLYSPMHFSKDKKSKTIESTTNKDIAPLQGSLSDTDVQRINYLYN